MATAREYFDQNPLMKFSHEPTLQEDGGGSYQVRIEVAYDFEGGSKYLRVYVPLAAEPDALLAHVLNNADDLIWNREANFEAKMGLVETNEAISNHDLRFSGRVLVWTPSVIDPARWKNLAKQIAPAGLSLLVRDGDYVKARATHETPLAFVSHDSRDKDSFVRDLANTLSGMLCPVWYDEYRLKPGDSLRASIEAGLKAAPKCVVVLSKSFFSNPGWGKREFDSIYTREIVEGKRVMIPIWLGVTKQEVYDYSPILVDTVGIDAGLGVDEVARRLAGVLR